MMCYGDRTFCTGDGCQKFINGCGRSLTEDILKQAERWWGGPGAPLARFETPRELECYVPPENT
jgi:hypothetical protein